MAHKQRLIYSLASGILLSLPWLANFSGLFLLVAFIPLFFIEDTDTSNPKHKTDKSLFLYISLSFLTWNTITTWWIGSATLPGAITAILLNTFLFSTVFWLYHVTRKSVGNLAGSLSLVVYWTAFEYGYLNAEISWPWLNLGNGFAHDIRLIQWYEYTGVLGGTIWILTVNLLLFNLAKNLPVRIYTAKLTGFISFVFLLILVPVAISLVRFYTYHEKETPCTIAVIQPNIDPYQKPDVNVQCRLLAHLIDSVGNKSIAYFLAPEATLNGTIQENTLEHNLLLNHLKETLSHFPHASLVTGAITFKLYAANEIAPATAQKITASSLYFSSFNSAIQIDTGSKVQVYHKSKLVVGVEKMPYAETLRFLKPLIEKLGGSFASHGTQSVRGVFERSVGNTLIAPVICYESVYGEFVTDYVRNGANLIFILTNDGWWGNTPGYRQHLSFASLRAIETRRSIARSANTGISAFINQRGEILNSLGWGACGSISATLNANNTKTFYVQHGDYLGRIAIWLSGAFLFFICIILGKKKLKGRISF